MCGAITHRSHHITHSLTNTPFLVFILILVHGSHKFITVPPPFSTYRFQEFLHLSQMELGFLSVQASLVTQSVILASVTGPTLSDRLYHTSQMSLIIFQ